MPQQINDWQPIGNDINDWETINDWQPINPIQQQQPNPIQEPKSLFSKGWDWASQSLIKPWLPGNLNDFTQIPGALKDIAVNTWEGYTNPAYRANLGAMERGMREGQAQGASSLFSPINIADAATGFGKGKILRGLNGIISGATAWQGADDLQQGNYALGGAELAGGLLGLSGGFGKGNLASDPRNGGRLLGGRVFEEPAPIPQREPLRLGAAPSEIIDAEIIPQGVRQLEGRPELLGLPAFGESSGVDATRFFSGRAGIGDVNSLYPHGLPDNPMQIVPDVGAQLASNRTIAGLPFKHPQNLLAPEALNVNPNYILEHPVGGALPEAPSIYPKEPFLENIPRANPLIEPEVTLPYDPNRFDIVNRGMSQSVDTGIPGRSSEYPNMFPGNANVSTRGNVLDNPLTGKSTAAKTAIQDPVGWKTQLWNLPRSLKASMDLSAPFRQGLGLVHKKEFWTSFDDMFKAFGSENAYKAVQDSIAMSPNHKLAMDSKLALTDLLNTREEQFVSKWAEKIPGVRASNRAYTAFLNKLRSDTFDSLIETARKAGKDPSTDLIFSHGLADFVNNATGRGSLGALEKNAQLLNNTLFSPKLIASRVQMLNPANYIKQDPMIRREYLKSLLAIATAGSTVTALGVASGLGNTEENPTSSDFGKLKIGNTRLDPFGGFQQYITLASRLITGETKTTSTKTSQGGQIRELGSSIVTPTRGQIAGIDTSASPNRGFVGNKLHPALGFALDWLKESKGRPYAVPEEISKLFVPMIMQDIWDLANEDPKLLPLIVPSAFGMSSQTY